MEQVPKISDKIWRDCWLDQSFKSKAFDGFGTARLISNRERHDEKKLLVPERVDPVCIK